MRNDEYKALSARLHSIDDVKRIATIEGYHEDMLLVIYTHRVTRNATKNFYRIKAQMHRLLRDWEGGTTLYELACRYTFPPVLMAYLIMMERGLGRKQFWRYVRDPSGIQNKRLRKEIQEVVDKDYIYSPAGTDLQVKRGKDGEATMAIILDHYKVSYLVEKELRGVSTKTPDFLLHVPLEVDGMVINWIESKANFGDLVEVKRNFTKQLSAYVKLFGPGMVVYWFGYVDDAPQYADIKAVDGTFIADLFQQQNWGKRVKFVEGRESPTRRFTEGRGRAAGASMADFKAGAGPGGRGEDELEVAEEEVEEEACEEKAHAPMHAHHPGQAQPHAQSQAGRYDRPRDRFKGRDRRPGRDRGRGRGRGGQRHDGRRRYQDRRPEQPQQRHERKETKKDKTDWTLDTGGGY